MFKLTVTLNKETGKITYYAYIRSKQRYQRISKSDYENTINSKLPTETITAYYIEDKKYKREHISF